MTTSRDPVPEIIAAGREIHRGDCEVLWADLIEGRCSWQETSERAHALISNANVPNPVVTGGLLSLYYLWQEGVPRDAGSQTTRRGAWRQALRKQDMDRDGWYRRHYQEMVRSYGVDHGCERAAALGAKLVGNGLLTTVDVDAVLGQLR